MRLTITQSRLNELLTVGRPTVQEVVAVRVLADNDDWKDKIPDLNNLIWRYMNTHSKEEIEEDMEYLLRSIGKEDQ